MAGFKKSTVESAPDISILGDSVTLLPSGYTESSARRDADNSRELVGTMARFRSSPLDFFREVSLHVNGTGWRAYDKYLGQPVFFPGFTEKMRGRILGSHMIQNKIIELARIRVKKEGDEGLLVEKSEEGREKRRVELENSLLEVAGKMVDEMICKMESKSFIRFAYYFITQLLTRAYHQGIHVSSEEILRLREVAAKAAEKKQSIIFLPSHRSHVDYVSLQILCYRLGLTLPVVVAGDNLNFPVVGPFLQNAGAMWIRRSFGDDQLYSSVVQSYVDTLLQNGYNFECFIEGGRSRTGKLLGPKFGILRFLCESLWSGRVEDAIVCPVSCQYDKVIEVDSYISELLGTPKKKENFADFFTGGASILNLKLGRIDVRFHQPWSLREFLTDQFIKATKLPQQMATPDGWTNDLKNRALKVMGYQVLEHINDVSVVMPTALVGTILLTLRGRGVGKSELIRRVDWLCDRVRDKGGRVAHFANLKTGVVVERALEVLGPSMVGRVQNLPEDTFFAVDRSVSHQLSIHLLTSTPQIPTVLLQKHDNPPLHPRGPRLRRHVHPRQSRRRTRIPNNDLRRAPQASRLPLATLPRRIHLPNRRSRAQSPHSHPAPRIRQGPQDQPRSRPNHLHRTHPRRTPLRPRKLRLLLLPHLALHRGVLAGRRIADDARATGRFRGGRSLAGHQEGGQPRTITRQNTLPPGRSFILRSRQQRDPQKRLLPLHRRRHNNRAPLAGR